MVLHFGSNTLRGEINHVTLAFLLFFVVAIIAAVFGFGGIAGEAAWIGKILLVVFLILAVVSQVMGRRGPSID